MKETTEEGEEKSAVDSAPPAVEEDPRALTLDDAEMILERGAAKMPFNIEKKLADTLKKEIEKYKKEYKGEAEKLFKKVPKVEAYDEMLEKMKKDLLFISPCEAEIVKTKCRYAFIMDMVK